MSRIRSVHPTLFTDEAFMAASMTARLLLIGLWTEADDYGVFAWKPLTLKARLMPADPVDIGLLLDELVEGGFIKRFEEGDHRFGVVRNFCRFQRPKSPRHAHPLPDEFRKYVGLNHADFPTPGEGFPKNSEKAPQMEEVGGRRKDGEEEEGILTTHQESVAARPPASPAGVSKDFLVLWGAWLNREGRLLAERAYASARREVDAETILTAAGCYVEKLIAKYPRLEDRERYAGLLANWLRAGRWRDWTEAEQRYDIDIDPPSDVDWRSQMLYWTNPNRGGPTRERWQVEAWGPMPGDPGCRVPAHLVEVVYRKAGEA